MAHCPLDASFVPNSHGVGCIVDSYVRYLLRSSVTSIQTEEWRLALHKYVLPLMAFCIFTTQANADCAAGFDQFTFCDIKGRDTSVSVCNDDHTVTYSYGAFGKSPELFLTETIEDIEYHPWDGPALLSGSVIFRNGNYAYEIVSAFEQVPFDEGASAITHFGWITVSRNGVTLDRLECMPEPSRYSYGDGIYNRKLAAGLYWDGYANGWVPLPD